LLALTYRSKLPKAKFFRNKFVNEFVATIDSVNNVSSSSVESGSNDDDNALLRNYKTRIAELENERNGLLERIRRLETNNERSMIELTNIVDAAIHDLDDFYPISVTTDERVVS
jgi:hypothetical protein